MDRFGPKLLIAVGAADVGWKLGAGRLRQRALATLYITYGVIGGLGTGIVYVGIIGLMVRWFPDRRGLATGIAAAGYGFGAFFTSFPIDGMIKTSGYAHTLFVWGIIQGVIGIVAALGLRMPPEGYRPAGFDPDTTQHRNAIEPQLHAQGNAAEPDLLSALRHDGDDVDQRPHGGLECRAVRQRVPGSRRCW